MKFIVAGCYREFVDWCSERNIDPVRDRHHYVSDVSVLYGLIGIEGRFIGSWAHRADIHDIFMRLHVSQTQSNAGLQRAYNILYPQGIPHEFDALPTV